MDEILKVDTIEQYNDLFGFETLHPLVAIVDLNKPESQRRDRMTLGFYSLFLKETKGCVINYGKSIYDFDAETIVAIAPGQTVGYSNDFVKTSGQISFINHFLFAGITVFTPKECLHLHDWFDSPYIEN